jgi:ribosomal protein S18 acetylase RimI-like enzyme
MVSIGRALETDIGALISLSRRTISASYRPLLGDAAVDGFIGSGAADAYVTDHIPQCTVIKHDEHIVGYCVCHDNVIDLMMIDVAHQRHGLGTLLLNHAEKTLFGSFPEIRLESFEGNDAANAFYRKNGWQESETYFDPESGVNKIAFRKLLTSGER